MGSDLARVRFFKTVLLSEEIANFRVENYGSDETRSY